MSAFAFQEREAPCRAAPALPPPRGSTGVAKDHGTTDTNYRAARPARRINTKSKASFRTTEFFAYIAAVIGVLVASAIADEASDFSTQEA